MNAHLLSKSQYVRSLQCPKSLWLYRHRKDLIEPTTPDQQMIFDQGTEVGVLAHQRFPGGVLIAEDHAHLEAAVESTRKAIEAGATVLYEAAFAHDGVVIRADIIEKSEHGWNLIEVKSSTEIKDVFLHDVAVQRFVMNGAGTRVHGAFVLHVNGEYVRRGQIDVDGFFSKVDVTGETDAMLAEVPARLAAAKATAALAEPPLVAIGAHCRKPYDCDFTAHCWAHVPAYSVFNLAYAKMDKKLDLWESGVKTVAEIPQGTKLSETQAVQVAVAKSRRPHIDATAIAAMLREVEYPRHFLDFETVNPAIPPYDGLKPYEQMPFEASVHVQQYALSPVIHHEFIGDGASDPRSALIDFLVSVIGPSGSVIAYNKSFEGGCLKSLATVGAKSTELLGMEKRLWDLAGPFRKAYYSHPDFKGSWSIKNILPVLVPDMSYAGLTIANGADAQVAYNRLMMANLTAEEREKIMADLRAYCATDTLAMVRLLAHVEDAAREKLTA